MTKATGGRAKPRKQSSTAERSFDERVLLLADGEDHALARRAAEKAGASVCPCRDMDELAQAIAAGAGAAVVTEEKLRGGVAALQGVLDRQRKWSELPVIVLFDEHAGDAPLASLDALESHAKAKVVLLHCPVPAASLASAMRSALKSRRQQYELRDLLARLNRDVRLRDQFLAMLGHELRNPLSSIGYVAEIFQMSGDALTFSQARWGAEVIGRQLRHLSRLLDQLLDVARVQRGKIKLEPATVNLGEVVTRSSASFESLARRREFTLTMPDRQVLVSGDPVRLTQVVENLLDNAFKYTKDGDRITISLEAAEQAILTIADTGRGIKRSAVQHVFEPFFQERQARSEAPPGLGLGLAMVDHIVRLHGGRVNARSEGVGRGAEFELRLPLAEARSEREVPRAPLPRRALSLLIVEDDSDSAEALAFLLKSLGHEPYVTYDGNAGIEAALGRNFDLVFIDIGLPDLSGEDVARLVREQLGSGAPRLVALTGHVQPPDGDRKVFDDYLLKPVARERVEGLFRDVS